MEASSGLSALADQQHFIAVYPQGLNERFTNIPFWADIGQIDYGINDVLFVSDLLDYLQRTFCVDAHRIYATGFSNGGGMTTLLACRLAGRIAAFAPMSGDHFAMPGGCHPGRPVPILYTHGSADPLVPYNGIPPDKRPDWPVPPVLEYLQTWAARDGCSSGPTIFLRQQGKAGQPGVTGMQWTGCQGNVRVVHYRIDGGGHRWPPLIGGHTPAQVMWQFFAQFTLP
jgi:polyhydroxybutyrate depolymerase